LTSAHEGTLWSIHATAAVAAVSAPI